MSRIHKMQKVTILYLKIDYSYKIYDIRLRLFKE